MADQDRTEDMETEELDHLVDDTEEDEEDGDFIEDEIVEEEEDADAESK